MNHHAARAEALLHRWLTRQALKQPEHQLPAFGLAPSDNATVNSATNAMAKIGQLLNAPRNS